MSQCCAYTDLFICLFCLNLEVGGFSPYIFPVWVLDALACKVMKMCVRV